MREFNLKEALEGKPLVTRDGLKVINFKERGEEHVYDYEGIIVKMGIEISAVFTENGKFYAHEELSRYDLFMDDTDEIPIYGEKVVIDDHIKPDTTKPYNKDDVRYFIGGTEDEYWCLTKMSRLDKNEGWEEEVECRITKWKYAVPLRLFKSEEPKIKEVTIEEVAKLLKVDPSLIRIKKD